MSSVAPLTAPTGAAASAEQAREALLGEFESLSRTQALSSVVGLRRAAIEKFAQVGFPSIRNEDWKYTSVAPIVRAGFRPAVARHQAGAGVAIPALPFAGIPGARLVFVDGVYTPSHSAQGSLPQGVRVELLSDALAREPELVEQVASSDAVLEKHSFAALNTAFLNHGVLIRLDRGAVVREPIQLVFVSTGTSKEAVSHQPRTIILAEEASQATVIETYFGSRVLGAEAAPTLTNAVTQVVTRQGAIIEHLKLQLESPSAYHVGVLTARQERDSRFTSHFVSLGGALVRNEVHISLGDEGAEAVLNGLYIARDRQHVDCFSVVDHAKPHCRSDEYYKGILDGQARGVFNGRILVQKDSQKTAADQSNKNLLLSESALINTKPQLQIYADDVKCSHGATIGKLDENAVFYLRSRGIEKSQARMLLTEAFAGEMLDRIQVEPLREELRGIFHEWLVQSGQSTHSSKTRGGNA